MLWRSKFMLIQRRSTLLTKDSLRVFLMLRLNRLTKIADAGEVATVWHLRVPSKSM